MKKLILFAALAAWLSACGAQITPAEETIKLTAVRNGTNSIQISVPEAWEEQDGKTAQMAGKLFAVIAASTNLVDFSEHAAPGIYLLVNSGPIGEEQTLEKWKDVYTAEPLNCVYVSQTAYNDSKFSGEIAFLENCKGGQNRYAILVSNPVEHPDFYTLTLMLNAVEGETAEKMTEDIQTYLATFFVTGELP